MACSRCVVQRLLANNHFYRKLYPVCFKSTKAKVATKKTLPENSVTKNEPIENKNTEVKSTKAKVATKKPPAKNSVTKDEQNKNTEVKSTKTKKVTKKTPLENSVVKDEQNENTEVKSTKTKKATEKTSGENSATKDEPSESKTTEVKSPETKIATKKTPLENSVVKDEQNENKNTEVKSTKTKVKTEKTPQKNSATKDEPSESKTTPVKSAKTKVATEKTPPENSAAKNEPNESKNTEVIEHVKTLDYVTSVPLYASDSEDVSQIEAESQFKSLIEKMSVKTLPSVSYVISSTQSPKSLFFLKRWKEKMIAELGEEGFKDYQQDTFRQGINFHANIQEFLTGKSLDDIQIDPANEGHWRSLKRVFPQMKKIVAIETPVFHPTLYYKGVFDCVGVYKDSLCVIDWKTSKQPKPLLSNTYDSPLQVAAYIGAINSSQVLADKGIDNIKSGVLVIAYPKGYPAHIHYIDQAACAEYWKQWLERLQLYWKKIADKKLGLNLVKNEDSEYSEMF